MATKLSKEERRIIAIDKARQRRVSRATQKQAQTQWFIDEVCGTVNKTMEQRVKLATELVRSRVVINISRPVTKNVATWTSTSVDAKGKKKTKRHSRIIVTNRSKPGEFPKADTTQLMKTIFGEVKQTSEGIIDGYIGTPLDYGLRLETSKKLNRSFLKRTFEEQRVNIFKILTGPITGVSNQTSDVGAR